MGTQEHTPLWVYSEDGVEIPFTDLPKLGESDEWEATVDIDREAWDKIVVELDRKTKWKIKWQFFVLAVKFLFMRW